MGDDRIEAIGLRGHPVGQPQPRHPRERLRVVADQGDAEGQRMGGDLRVERSGPRTGKPWAGARERNA